jgi:amino acid adenylation domain-containing protein/non-ribosomal peptide synthase protein (TIGR01720 family)
MTYWNTHISDAHALDITEAISLALNGLITDPDQLVGNLNLVSSRSFNQVLDWCTPITEAREELLTDIFSKVALSSPGSPAIASTDVSLTYGELDNLSTRLANHLIDIGIGPETRVPLFFEKSAWTIVSQLAVLKAGGCMVPIETGHPMERIKDMIDDIDATVILTSRSKSGVWENSDLTAIVVDRNTLEALEDRPLKLTGATPSNAAYIIFTSGTTGRPKGTIIEHRAFASNVDHMARVFGQGENARFLQFASYGFDGSLAEILGTLLSGGCLCIPNDHERSNNIVDFLNRFAVNAAILSPSFARLLSPKDVQLQTLTLAGEAMSAEDVMTWSKDVRLVNCYGPSECSVAATANCGLSDKESFSKIGTSMGSQVWIVDPNNHNQLVPTGAPGEILIGGPTLARGYLNNSRKTNEVFITNPMWLPTANRQGGGRPLRFYKTGDLGRRNTDGSIGFIGRKDSQVKIRGQRLELSEVEHHILTQSPAVRQVSAQIITRTGCHEDRQLVAFFCGKESTNVEPMQAKPTKAERSAQAVQISDDVVAELQNLSKALHTILPSYMVPSMFIPVNRIPLTVSDKVDSRCLSTIAKDMTESEVSRCSLALANKRMASTQMETALVNIWEAALKLSAGSLGVDDNFFRSGGDSITAIKVVSQSAKSNILVSVADIFSHPTVASLAEVVTHIDNDLQELAYEPFSLINSETRTTIVERMRVGNDLTESQILDAYPATPLQEALFALSVGKHGTYVMQNLWEIGPEVDLNRYLAAWEVTRQENPILRTRMIDVGPSMYQVIVNDRMELHTGSSLASYLAEDCERTVTYGAQLARYALITEDGGKRYIVWTIHHSIYDGWSMATMMDNVGHFYLHDGPLSASTPFSGYIKYVLDIDQAAAREFWSSTLSGAAPSDFPRLPSSHKPCADATITHKTPLIQKGLFGITTSTMIQAAWALLLSKYCSSTDTVFGMIVSGRDAPVHGIEHMVGPTIATVPVRVSLENKQSIPEYLAMVQSQTTDMIPFQHVGVQNIRRLGSDCLSACDFRSLLVVQPEPDSTESHVPGTKHILLPEPSFQTYPLVVECRLGKDGVQIVAQYDSATIERGQIQRVLAQLDHLLQQLSMNAQNKDCTIGSLQILSQKEFDDIQSWNGACPETIDSNLPNVFAQQVKKYRTSTAVSSWDGQLTYGKLDKLSTKLAAHLHQYGVGPEVIVPLYFEKSMWTIVAMMAVVKAGGAFVMLEQKQPLGRLKGIVAQVKPVVLLTSSKLAPVWEAEQKVMAISEETIAALPESFIVPGVKPRPNNSVYLIFTSGSTGMPKGVVIEHSALLTSAAHFCKRLCMDHTSRVLQSASYSFDASIMEILGTLTCGGCICIPSDDARDAGPGPMIRETSATWMFATPSLIKLVKPSEAPTVKQLVLGGEAPQKEDIETWSGALQLFNGYGPSECTIISAINSINDSKTHPADIGYAVGSSTWIVDPDDSDRLMPVGCPGELLIQGPILARGYHEQPELTSASFRSDLAFGSGRFYKTGDLVCYNPDGSIRFLGRKDTQAKLNGQRMELGEIESAITSQADVQNALVIIPKAGFYVKKLVAIVAFKDCTAKNATALRLINDEMASRVSPQLDDVRQKLSDKLPSYMVPTVWVFVQGLPLSVAGKIDRKTTQQWLEELPEQTCKEINSLFIQDEMVPPTTETEKQLASFIVETLNIRPSQISTTHTFVGLGGDSITAMQLVSKCRNNGFSIPLASILSNQTLAQLAASTPRSERRAFTQVAEVDTAFNLTPIQQLYLDLAEKTSTTEAVNLNGTSRFNQSFFVRLQRHVAAADMATAINAIVKSHSMLRARFTREENGNWTQRIVGQVSGSHHYEVSSAKTMAEIVPLIALAQKRLNVQDGPVFSATFFDEAAEGRGQLLFLTAHHLVVDLVSWRVILEDIETYLTRGSAPARQSLPFQSWAKMQESHANESLAVKKVTATGQNSLDLQYWGMTSSSPNTYGNTQAVSFALDGEATFRLLGACHTAMRTKTVDVLLASVFQSFSNVFSDREVPTIFVEGHGREPWDEDIDIVSTVGWFTALNPVHVAVKGDILDTVRRTKDARCQVADNGRSYMASRYNNSVDRKKPGAGDIAEIVFNYLGLYQQLERADGLFSLQDTTLPGEAEDVGPNTPRIALFEITAAVANGQLEVSFNYNTKIAKRERVKEWIHQCHSMINHTVERLSAIEETIPTLSDFPLLALDYERLPGFEAEIRSKLNISDLSSVEDIYPCSMLQEALLISNSLDSTAYQTHVIFEAKSSNGLQLEKLVEAWGRVVSKYSVLRTIFVEGGLSNDIFNQAVVRKLRPPITELKTDDDRGAVQLLREQPPIAALGSVPHRMTLCQTPDRTLCRLDMSHAIVDGTSIGIMMKDFCTSYESTVAAGSSSSYKDYIAFLKNRPAGEAIEFWKGHLDQITPCLFPTRGSRANINRQFRSLDVDLKTPASELLRFCDDRNLTPANLIQTAWAIVLRCFTRSDQVCFGYVTSGRDIPVKGIESMVGPFVNVLVNKVEFTSQEMSSTQVADTLQQNFLATLPYQHCSLAEIQHSLQVQGGRLFNTAISAQHSGSLSFSGEGSALSLDVIEAFDPSEVRLIKNDKMALANVNLPVCSQRKCQLQQE